MHAVHSGLGFHGLRALHALAVLGCAALAYFYMVSSWGGYVFLINLIPLHALVLMLTGRFLHADRALAVNLVSEVVPDDELETAAQSYIDDMLTTSPMGLRLTKDGLTHAIDAASLEAAMAIENRNQLLTLNTEDAKEGMRAFVEKRAPNYKGR